MIIPTKPDFRDLRLRLQRVSKSVQFHAGASIDRSIAMPGLHRAYLLAASISLCGGSQGWASSSKTENPTTKVEGLSSVAA